MEQKSGAEEWRKRRIAEQNGEKIKLKIDRSKRGSKIILVEIKISKIKNHGY